MTTQPDRKVGRAFWLQWTIANALGWLTGAILINPVANVILGALAAARIMYFSTELSSSYIPASMIGGGIYGVFIGLMQWFVLRRYLGRSSVTWVIASVLGWTLGAGALAYMITFLGDIPASIVRGAILGSIVGTSQWFVLRQRCDHAGWWVLAVGVSWSLSSLVYDLFEVTFGSALANINSVILNGINGIAFGMITGLAMMWLLNHPKHSVSVATPVTQIN